LTATARRFTTWTPRWLKTAAAAAMEDDWSDSERRINSTELLRLTGGELSHPHDVVTTVHVQDFPGDA
jgi:hypothetical protein